MESFFHLLANTFIFLRPYVFLFFLIYFIGCSLHLGLKRTILFGIAGYLIAWLSEFSSIHNGIPYGHYFYIEHTRGEELWVFGVPLMDSLSYVFLAYASYSMSLLVISPIVYSKGVIYFLETRKIRHSAYTRILGSIFFVYLDIIIDPVALRGNRWFLGQIYGYPEEGVYFGIPISNFMGWFLVGFLLIYTLQKIDHFLYKRKTKDLSGYRYSWRYLIGPILYLSIVLFNISITFFIQEYTLGWAGIFILFLPSFLIYSVLKIKLSAASQNAIKDHLEDFPQAIIPHS